jgi:hypothetical protein
MATREKSNLYPNATWEDCFEFIKVIDSFNLKTVSYSEVAKKYGLSSTTTKSFTGKISSSKQFGLITTSSGSIQITDLAKKLIYPTDDIRKLKIESFRLPPLYDKLISAYDGKALPNNEKFENILMSEYKIAKNVKSNAAKCFFESANQLGLIKGGILCYNDSIDENSISALDNDSSKAADEYSNPNYNDKPTDNISHSNELSSSAAENSSDFIIQNIPVESGKVAKIIIPIDANEDDLLLIKDMFEVLLKRKFKINTEN